MSRYFTDWMWTNLAKNIGNPKNGFFGRMSVKLMLSLNTGQTENSIRLAKIGPDHKVLEVGFCHGNGISNVYDIIKDGTGVSYGIDTSEFMVNKTKKRFRREIQAKKVVLFYGDVISVPLEDSSIDAVLHNNCFCYWPSFTPRVRELQRILKPGGVMVTTLSLDNMILYAREDRNLLRYNNHCLSPLSYMKTLRKFGFHVYIQNILDQNLGKRIQSIVATLQEDKSSTEATTAVLDSNDDHLFDKEDIRTRKTRQQAVRDLEELLEDLSRVGTIVMD